MEGTIIAVYLGLGFIFQKETFVDEKEPMAEASPPCQEELRIGDAKIVIENLGMIGWSDGEWREEERLMDGIKELLEEKEGSIAELKEAFYVFDRNEDGFIRPSELWSVMRRLEMEGRRMEDCERMTSAFDEDGDGRISFLEFKRLLELELEHSM